MSRVYYWDIFYKGTIYEIPRRYLKKFKEWYPQRRSLRRIPNNKIKKNSMGFSMEYGLVYEDEGRRMVEGFNFRTYHFNFKESKNEIRLIMKSNPT